MSSDAHAKPFYLLHMFPYPKGAKHVAQARLFLLLDAFSRHLTMCGHDVFRPFGFDAFGLPAERAARAGGTDPATWTERNMELFRRAWREWGIVHDERRDVVTCRPAYYRWTQWLFLRLLDAGLAYRAEAPVNWCGHCETVLADEQVAEGACEQCGGPVAERRLEQWFLRITRYADELVDGLDGLDWPEHIKDAQRHWIGRQSDEHGDVRLRLRDWLVSRQRGWGTPLPVVHCERCGVVPVPDADLPVVLPAAATEGRPLAACPGFAEVACPRCGGDARRDTDTLDTFVDSSWYFLRHLAPDADHEAFPLDAANERLPVDLYLGGASYAVSHLLYARFMTKALRDLGLLRTGEPFRRLFATGAVKGRARRCPAHGWRAEDEVRDGRCTECGRPVEQRVTKMSTSRRNFVTVGSVVERDGADVARAAILGLGPHERDLEWHPDAVTGARRWIRRLSRLAEEVAPRVARADVASAQGAAEHDRALTEGLDAAIERSTRAFAACQVHVAVACSMEATNAVARYAAEAEPWNEPLLAGALADLAALSAPFAPVAAETLAAALGGGALDRWPRAGALA